MKKVILTLVSILLVSLSIGQNVNNLDGYLFLYIYPITYPNNQVDIYGITSHVREAFVDKGYGFVSDFQDPRQQFPLIKENPCIVLYCAVNHEGMGPYISAELTLTFTNCYSQIVYKTSGKGGILGTYSKQMANAVNKALAEFSSHKYKFNPELTPKITYPDVEMTDETEESLMNYFSTNKLDKIEGIYKSYQSGAVSTQNYKIGIKKFQGKYKAILLESDFKHWKPGEVKAVFEVSSVDNLFSTKWFMANKFPYETFASMENEAILSIEFPKDPKIGGTEESKFIKMYPSVSDVDIFRKNNTVSSGSGFFITTNGLIATNAHVVENRSTISVMTSNDQNQQTYNAKILLLDKQNDVAILQINDDKFHNLNALPYSIIEKSDVGEKVFTIGYPLNDVMGTNYKVTNGIISAKSGIEDDVRYYQISVPLQPGNSGGPLFNDKGNVIGITSAKLNEKAVGTTVENVNYAIKSAYLLNLYNMLPNVSALSNSSSLAMKSMEDQIKILKNYVCLIKAY